MSKQEYKKNNSKKQENFFPNVENQPKKKKFSLYWLYLLLFGVFIAMTFWGSGGSVEAIDNIKLRKMITDGDISKITVFKHKDIAEIYLQPNAVNKDTAYKKAFEREKDGPHFFIEITDPISFKEDIKSYESQILEKQLATDTTAEGQQAIKDNFKYVNIVADNSKSWSWDSLIWLVLPICFLIFIFIMMRNAGRNGGAGGIFSFGKSKAQLYDHNQQVSITFKDVAGLPGAKEEVMEIVDFLKNPKKYTNLGGKIPKGALLVGPPGTGKTLLARAVAGEAQVPFFSLSGSDFVEMFVGVGASRVRDLFKTAKEKAPCIIFIDEIDAIGRARGRNSITGTNDERENTLNQLLTEMDGFSGNVGIIILAATNRADVLDKALLRAGRFDRQIHVELPDLEERKEIFEVHVRDLKLSKSVDLGFFARQTPGFSGADIANVCNEAALIAARYNKKEVDKQDFLNAIDRIVGGLERRSKIISADEKKVIAYHEAGHATVSWMLKYAAPLVKVTIVPRGKSLGAAWYLPEERQITNIEQMMDEITATLGGRAAEEVIFGTLSTGALNDLERVTKQAYAMVAYYGLNPKLGNISYYDSSGQSEYAFQRPYSEKTAQLMDDEVHQLIEKAYLAAKKILVEHKAKLTILAEKLLDKEVIFREDLENIFGKRPYEAENTIFSGETKPKRNTHRRQRNSATKQDTNPKTTTKVKQEKTKTVQKQSPAATEEQKNTAPKRRRQRQKNSSAKKDTTTE
ncbi:MAG: ATP-dependent zinc metalloprotease FtsH [Bacteroidales bacterium]|jgi:cell division protease FtsH|nr:ATP-dependent zinc metalloprotease FtsH [Bacteroidales bacterium]